MTDEKDTIDNGAQDEIEEEVNSEENTEAQEQKDTSDNEDALLAGKYKSPQELEKAHLELQRKLGQRQTLDPEELKAQGFVTREELQRVQRESESLAEFLTAYPQAKSKLDTLEALRQTDLYKGKSHEEVYKSLYSDRPSESKRIVREVIIGDTPKTFEKSIYEMSFEEIDELGDDEIEALTKAEDSNSSLLKGR